MALLDVMLDSSVRLLSTWGSDRATNTAKNRVVLSVLYGYLGRNVFVEQFLLLMNKILQLSHLFHDLLVEALLRFQFSFK